MKIPLDFFLRLIEKFLKEQEFDNVIKKLKKHFEAPEEDFEDILSDLSLQDIISKYIKENKELKKKLKAKAKQFLEENKAIEEQEEKNEEKEEKLSAKKRKRTMSSTKEEAKEDKPKKKRKRTMSSNKDEMELEENDDKKNKKRKRTMSSTKEEKEKEKEISDKKRKKTEEKNDDEEKETKKEKKKKKKNDDDDIDLEKEVKFIPKPKSDNNPNRIPFKRIDEANIKHQVPENLRDNSYAAFMKQTGDDFGKAANDKLIATRGKGFRKEKTKFKNKTFHGGMTISTSVRSIPLEDDSSSDEK